MTTSNDPDEIRADIETRAALSDNVDDLAESVKPKNVAGRQVGKVKEAASNLKERVMGPMMTITAALRLARSAIRPTRPGTR